MRAILLAGLILVCVVGAVGAAEVVSARDRYYDGLSRVIKENLDDVQACLRKVESYINENKKLIEDMLKAPDSLEIVGQKKAKITPQARFNRAMAELSEKYPGIGQKIMMLNIRALIPPIENK